MPRFRCAARPTPRQWLIRQRIDLALRLLEAATLPVDRIAHQSGLGTAASLRQHLHTALGVSPAAYRRTFRT